MWRIFVFSAALVGLAAMPSAWPEPARAGAWTQREGRGQIIFSSGRRSATPGSLISGTAEGDVTISQLYLEYGFTDAITLGASAYTEYDVNDADRGSAAAAVFARARVWQNATGSLASVQVAYSQPLESLINEAFGRSKPNSTPEVQLRGLFGSSWWGDWGSAFLSTEGGYNWRSEGTPDEIRLDATLGYEPRRCCMALLSVYGAVPLGSRPGLDSDTALKIAPSLAYTLWPEIGRNRKKPLGPVLPATIQIGLDYDLLDRDEGVGFFVSIWRRF